MTTNYSHIAVFKDIYARASKHIKYHLYILHDVMVTLTWLSLQPAFLLPLFPSYPSSHWEMDLKVNITGFHSNFWKLCKGNGLEKKSEVFCN